MNKNLQCIKNPSVALVFRSYPDFIKEKLLYLRNLILDEFSKIEGIGEIEETLKWGEPSYISSIGTAIRIDWKKKYKDQYFMYFNCKTSLVATFKKLYPKDFMFGGNRSIIFSIEDEVPEKQLRQCIGMALTYKKRKN